MNLNDQTRTYRSEELRSKLMAIRESRLGRDWKSSFRHAGDSCTKTRKEELVVGGGSTEVILQTLTPRKRRRGCLIGCCMTPRSCSPSQSPSSPAFHHCAAIGVLPKSVAVEKKYRSLRVRFSVPYR